MVMIPESSGGQEEIQGDSVKIITLPCTELLKQKGRHFIAKMKDVFQLSM